VVGANIKKTRIRTSTSEDSLAILAPPESTRIAQAAWQASHNPTIARADLFNRMMRRYDWSMRDSVMTPSSTKRLITPNAARPGSSIEVRAVVGVGQDVGACLHG